MSFEKTFIMGNLGNDPELRTVEGDRTVASFSVAVNKRRKDKNGEPINTTKWYRVSAWGKQAELAAKFLQKGNRVYVEGELDARMYSKDGAVNVSLDLTASNIQFIDTKDAGNIEADELDGISHNEEASSNGDKRRKGSSKQVA